MGIACNVRKVISNTSPLLILPLLTVLLSFPWSAWAAQCGAFQYDPAKLECCNNFTLCERDLRQCCGKFCALRSTTVCCNGSVLDKCSVFQSECCGKKCYDRAKQICCGGKLIPRKDCYWEEGGCCGGVCYNERTHLCCDNKAIAKCGPSGVSECCGGNCYNNYTQSCCGNRATEKCPTGECCGDRCCPMTTLDPNSR